MRFFKDEALDAQFVRSLGKVAVGAGDVGEMLSVAASVHDRDAWGSAWRAMAERLEVAAKRAESSGHARSGGEMYLRAHEYRRQSYFFLRDDLGAPALVDGWNAQRDDFRNAMRLLGVRHRVVAIPFDGGTLDGYAFVPEGVGPHAVIVAPSGYDAPIEEFYALAGVPFALARGYAVVMFDGPGQGGALYERQLFMRPDYENVVGPVLDWVQAQDFADPRRLALLGRSFGGYLAPRAAAGESRLRALIADPGHLDVGAAVRARVPPVLLGWLQRNPERAERLFQTIFRGSPGLRYDLLARAAVHGLSSPVDYLHEIQRYTLADRVDRITCPTLVCTQGDDEAESRALFDALECPKRLIVFTAEEGAGGHCEGAAQSLFFQRALDWLDEVLAAD